MKIGHSLMFFYRKRTAILTIRYKLKQTKKRVGLPEKQITAVLRPVPACRKLKSNSDLDLEKIVFPIYLYIV